MEAAKKIERDSIIEEKEEENENQGEIARENENQERKTRENEKQGRKVRENENQGGIDGGQSIIFESIPYIINSASIVSKKEVEGPLGEIFDLVGEDELFGKETWEEAESEMQKLVCEELLGKEELTAKEIRFLFGGDLLRQGIATSLGVEQFHIPMFGLYGACSTSGEAMALAAMAVSGGYGKYMMTVTSSHFASAEKEFRFPLLYASQRPLSTQWTVTGSGAFLIGTKKSKVKIGAITVGKIVDYGLKDPQNMGACMAPAAMDTILANFKDLHRKPEDYDQIITGDLGMIGSEILVELLEKKGIQIKNQHLDCGSMIYESKAQGTHAGGSGCGCSAVTLASYILPRIASGTWKRVLFLPTGALMSTISFNEGKSVAGIAHGIVLEHEPN